MALKDKNLIDKLISKVSRKPDYYVPDKYDLEQEFRKYKKSVESNIQDSTAFSRLGRLYHHKGDINLAIENYQYALELEPSDSFTHYNLGNAYFKDSRFDEAIVEFSKAVELDPQDVYSYNALANSYLRMGKYEDALNNHRKALRLSAKDPYAFKGMGDVYMHLGNYEEAMNYYQKALESSPKFSMVYYNLGLLYGKLEKHEESVKNIAKAIELDKTRATFYLALGNSYRELKDYVKALENYEKAIELEPSLKEAYRSYAILLSEQGNYSKAIERIEKISELFPSEGWPFGILGLIYFLKKEYQTAIFYYGMGIDYEPEEPSLYTGLGDIYYEQYELTKAGNMYENSIKLSPSSWAYKQLARIYQEQGLWNLADRNYQEAIKLSPGFYDVYIDLGKFYSVTGKLEQALSTFDKALSLSQSLIPVCSLEKGIIFIRLGEEEKAGEEFKKGINFLLQKPGPDNIHDYLQLALFYREMKDNDKVIEYLEKAINLKPTSEIYYHLGYAYYQKNIPDKASEYYEKSIKLNNRFCSPYEGLGIISLNQEKFNEGRDYFNKLLEINPRHLYANYHLAKVHEAIGNYDKGEEEYLLSLKISDFNHKSHHGLANLYARKGDYSKAISHYEKAISLNPGEPLYYSDLGDLYKKRGMNKEAAHAYQKAMRYCSQDTIKQPYENLYSVMMWRHLNVIQSMPFQQVSSEVSEQMEKTEDIYNIIPVEPLLIELGRELLPFIDPNQGAPLFERLSILRKHIAMETGFVVPRVSFRDNMFIKSESYLLKVHDVETAKGELQINKLLASHKPDLLDLLKGEKCNDPVYNSPSIWIDQDQRKASEELGFMVFDPMDIIIMHLSEVIRGSIDNLFGFKETHCLIETVKKVNPVVIEEVYPSKLSLCEIHSLLRNLLQERVSIRNLVSIFESFARYAEMKDIALITEHVRQDLKYVICRDLKQSSGEISVFYLSPSLERFILRYIKSNMFKSYFSRDFLKPFYELLNRKSEEIKEHGLLNMVIITSPDGRRHVKKLISQDFPNISVLSSLEISPDVKVKNLGDLALQDKVLQRFEIQLSPDGEEIIKVLSNSIYEGKVDVKISALRNMVKINKDKALIYVMSSLRSEHPELQIEAQNILGEMWG